MKVLLITVAFAALAVESVFGQCDTNKVSECTQTFTSGMASITADNACETFQTYINCYEAACPAAEIPAATQTQLNDQLSTLGFNCNLNFSSGASALAATSAVMTLLMAALATIFRF